MAESSNQIEGTNFQIVQNRDESGTALSKMIAVLIEHRCPDASESLDLSQCGERPVAFGGFGDIYYGKTKNGTPVAIKCARINVDEMIKDSTLRDVAKELHAWSKCKHENIVELIGLTRFRGQLATLSPWMKNRALPQYLVQYPDADRFQLCLQIATGLAYLHDNGMVHGDVKGWNVLISETGSAQLTDLGSTRLKDASLQFTSGTSTTALSLRWAAPELLGGLSSYSAQADVYALGMTILEVMTGKVPYEGQTDLAVCGLVLANRTFPLRPGNTFPNDFRGNLSWYLLLSCWTFEPSERPNASQLVQRLRGVNGTPYEERETVGRIPWHDRTWSTAQRNHLSAFHLFRFTAVERSQPEILKRGTYMASSSVSGISLSRIACAAWGCQKPACNWFTLTEGRNQDVTIAERSHGNDILTAIQPREGSRLQFLRGERTATNRSSWVIVRVALKKFAISLSGTDLCIGIDPDSPQQVVLRYGFAEPQNHWQFRYPDHYCTVTNKYFAFSLDAGQKYHPVSNKWYRAYGRRNRVQLKHETAGIAVCESPAKIGSSITINRPLYTHWAHIHEWMIRAAPEPFQRSNPPRVFTISFSDDPNLFWGYQGDELENLSLQLRLGAEDPRHWLFDSTLA